MKFAPTLGVMVLAGALGALAGGAMSVLGGGRAENGADTELVEQLAGLRKDVEGLRDAVRESRDDVGDLESRLISAEMDMNRMRDEVQAAANAAPASAPGLGGPIVFDSGSPDSPGTIRMPSIQLDPARFSGEMTEAAKAAAKAMQERFAKSMELRQLPEEEQWRKAEEELGLTTAQTDEIKAAKEEFDAAMQEASTSRTSTTADGATMMFRTVDGNKMRAARTQFDERVGRVLSDNQKERWESEGWKGALTGAGGPGQFASRVRRASATGDTDGPAISTGIITIDVQTNDEK